MDETLAQHLTTAERDLFQSLDTPAKIQAFLDETPYSPENANRCPVMVLRERKAHCLDGALFAAAALRQLGYPPLIVDMLPEPGTDDDHVIAVFWRHGRVGAVAKSNFVGLRYREPVFRSVRELVMSYFEVFFNLEGVKTMRAYTAPFDLSKMDDSGWMWSNAGADAVEKRLYTLRAYPVITPQMRRDLVVVDPLSYKVGLSVANYDGLFKPKKDPQ